MTTAGHRGAPAHHDHRRARLQRGVLRRRAGARRASTLGPVNEGWRVAMTTLTHERGGVAQAAPRPPGARSRELHRGREDAPGAQRRDARPRTRCCASGSRRVYLEARAAQAHRRPGDLRRAARPRASGPESSIAKLGVERDRPAHRRGRGRRARARRDARARGVATGCRCRQATIAGGTTQINKNIIAQRVLGLPRG